MKQNIWLTGEQNQNHGIFIKKTYLKLFQKYFISAFKTWSIYVQIKK